MKWMEPIDGLRAERGCVDVWRTRVDVGADLMARYENLLSDDEAAKAERYRIERKRVESIVSRGFLRRVLGVMLDVDGRGLVFGYGANGKPGLKREGEGDNEKVSFNVSHSGDVVLIAVTLGNKVGVDVEMVRESVEYEKIARRFFSAREVGELMELDESERRRAFFRCWTRKEAFLKARGEGISFGLDKFDVTVGDEARLIDTQWDENEAKRWWMMDLDVGEIEGVGGVSDEYVGCVAAKGSEMKLRCWNGLL